MRLRIRAIACGLVSSSEKSTVFSRNWRGAAWKRRLSRLAKSVFLLAENRLLAGQYQTFVECRLHKVLFHFRESVRVLFDPRQQSFHAAARNVRGRSKRVGEKRVGP